MATTAQAGHTAAGDIAAPHYSMLLQWDPEDRIYVVSVPELPGLHAHGATYEEAARKGAAFIEEWVATLEASSQAIPPAREWHP